RLRRGLPDPAARRALAGRTPGDVRTRGRRAPAAVLVRRRRTAAAPRAHPGPAPVDRALRRRSVRHRGHVPLPRWARQRGLARRPQRALVAVRHDGRDRLVRLATGSTAAAAGRWGEPSLRARPRRPAGDGWLVPAHVGARRAQDGARRGAPGECAVPPRGRFLKFAGARARRRGTVWPRLPVRVPSATSSTNVMNRRTT